MRRSAALYGILDTQSRYFLKSVLRLRLKKFKKIKVKN
jgi:hypothetical protein